ncbi:hypothetical protein [Metallosphaera hakonensis]|uniref:SRPBCC family protein n=1 Tax=Metallosphaera hakonensis JCM 8857 = DSM 7519 TaxID=1293036 RepID=A0A2U9IW81_9CREN|nr:hypothetical protein [Metallosphaera hakonensis]AWS00223.1 SRPBCC family protein [Metallosphaera hakonensis JCM 8857 = DSM 7519]
MISFSVSKTFSPELREEIWEIVKDINSMPKYWKGIRELNVNQVSHNVFEGSVRFAFPSTSRVRIQVLDYAVLVSFLNGILSGENRIEVGQGELRSTWNVEMPFYMRPFEGRNKEHFMEGAEHALERIIAEAIGKLSN